MNTRLLLTCAAIGVGGGLVFAVTGYLHVVVLATIPVVYGVLIGVYFFPGVVAQSLLRRPGVAVVTGVIAGLTASAFNPTNVWRHIGTGLLIGLLQELPFAISRYRYWKAWVFYLAAAIAGIIFGGVVLIALGVDHFAPVAEIVSIAVWVLTPLLVTWLARLVAAGIDRTGAARGLQRDIDRREPGSGRGTRSSSRSRSRAGGGAGTNGSNGTTSSGGSLGQTGVAESIASTHRAPHHRALQIGAPALAAAAIKAATMHPIATAAAAATAPRAASA